LSNISALVVDDSSTSRILLAKILKKMDIHTEQACSGEDALSQLSWYQPNFIFLDHVMPGMDGFETLKTLKAKEETKHIPVIMYTSQHAHKYYEEAHQLGAAGVISKHIDRDKLYLMLNRLCKTHANERDVPTVYDEVRHTLSQEIKDGNNAKFYARVSTLETAYEELQEENRLLRLELTQFRVQQEELQHKHQHFSLPQIILALFLAFALFASTYTWFTTQKIEQAYIDTQSQISLINDLIDEMIDLLEQRNSD
jgi:CheY-like chemotaxis protein